MTFRLITFMNENQRAVCGLLFPNVLTLSVHFMLIFNTYSVAKMCGKVYQALFSSLLDSSYLTSCNGYTGSWIHPRVSWQQMSPILAHWVLTVPGYTLHLQCSTCPTKCRSHCHWHTVRTKESSALNTQHTLSHRQKDTITVYFIWVKWHILKFSLIKFLHFCLLKIQVNWDVLRTQHSTHKLYSIHTHTMLCLDDKGLLLWNTASIDS